MKTTHILVLGALAALTSCGMIAQSSSSDDGHRFTDGIYSSTPSFRTKEEKDSAKSENEALVNKTKESAIYLFGDKKDTIVIPENFSARIQYDQKIGGTTITVGENPYDWRWDLENRYGYWYGPYSIGSSWYWSRHYSPYWTPYWGYYNYYNPWHYGSLYDPWYYIGLYDPWYYGGYWGGYWGGHYAGYWGWHDPWHHYHHHHGWYNPHYQRPVGGPTHIGGHSGGRREYTSRVNTERSSSYAGASYRNSAVSAKKTVSRTTGGGTLRGGVSVGNRVSRASSTASRGTSLTRSSSPTYRKPTSAGKTSTSVSSDHDRNNPAYDRGPSTSHSRSSSSSTGSYSRNSSYGGSSYNRSSSSSSGSYSRSSSGGGGYSRSSSGGYRR